MNGNDARAEEQRLDLQMLLKDLETEGVLQAFETVKQSDISSMFKNRKPRGNDE